MQKILTDSLSNLTGWQRQVREAIEYSLGLIDNSEYWKDWWVSNFRPTLNDVYLNVEDNTTEVKCFLASTKGSDFDLLLFSFHVSFAPPEPIHHFPIRLKTEGLSDFSEKSLEEWSEKLKEFALHKNAPIFPANEQSAYSLRAKIKFGSNIVRMM